MKGIAIPYIVAIVLGIAVIAVIGFTFFSQTGQITVENCKVKLGAYCTVWQVSGYQGPKPGGGWETYASGCSAIGVTDPNESKCDETLGKTTTKKGASEECASDSECQSGNCATSNITGSKACSS